MIKLSHHDYEFSGRIAMQGFPFYALVAAAMRQADSDNTERLMIAFPEVYEDLTRRYNAPGGWLPEEPHPFAASFSDSTKCIVCGKDDEHAKITGT